MSEKKPRLVGLSEAARLAGLSKQRMQVLTERPDFPEVYATYSKGRLWRIEDIERWIAERQKTVKGRGKS